MAFTDPDTRAAITAVHVVPILAPSVNGNICSKVMIFKPTNGVKVDVVIELDCNNIVRIIPKNMDKYALLFNIRRRIDNTIP